MNIIKKHWKLWLGLSVALLLLVALRWVVGTILLQITVGHDTTRITGPIRADGAVDYIEAVNERYGKGVTQKENAAVELYAVIGDKFLPQRTAEKAAARMGMPLPVKVPGEFLRFDKYMEKRTGKVAHGAILDTWSNMADSTKKSPWQAKDVPEVADWLTENSAALEHVTRASHLPRYFIPLMSSGNPPELFEVPVESLGAIRQLCNALCSRCMLEVAKGDISAAWADSMTELRLGWLVMQGPNMLHRLAGYAMVNQACDGQGVILREHRLDALQARKMREELLATGSMPGLDEVIDVQERYTSLDMIVRTVFYGPEVDDRIPGVPPPTIPPRANTFTFGPWQIIHADPVLKETNGRWDRVVAAGREPEFAARESALETVATDARRFEFSLKAGPVSSHNALRLMGSLFLTDFRTYFRTHTMAQQHLDMVKDSLQAVEQFGSGQKVDEQSLDKWVQTLPPDQFTGNRIDCKFEKDHITFTSKGPVPLPDATSFLGTTIHCQRMTQSVSVRIK